MKIVIQDRRSNAFLADDSRWVTQLHYARSFRTSLDALRFCAGRNLTQMDLLVSYSGTKRDLRLPLC